MPESMPGDGKQDIQAEVEANLSEIGAKISAAAEEAGRARDDVSLIAVSKVQPNDRVEAALIAGHRLFGENRVQEAQSKWPDFKQRYDGVTLHLIGPLQTNKVRDAVSLFDVIETVDRPKLAAALKKEMDRQGVSRRCFVQVNTGFLRLFAGVHLYKTTP